MFKKFVKWLLKKEINAEIQSLRSEIECYKDDVKKYKARIDSDNNLLMDQCDKIRSLQTAYDVLRTENEEFKKQNAILRQYYHLDEEPSQETCDKMYLDEKYREQEKELARLQAYKDALNSCAMLSMLLNSHNNHSYYLPYGQSQAWISQQGFY